MNRPDECKVSITVLHRQKAIEKGFAIHDFGLWIDVMAQWLFSCGAKEVGYGSDPDDDKDAIIVTAVFEREPDELLIGDAAMRGQIKARSPILLEDFDPYTMRPVLQAWDYVFKAKNQEFAKLHEVARSFMASIEHVTGMVPKLDTDYFGKIERHVRMATPIPDSPDPYDDSDRRESCGA